MLYMNIKAPCYMCQDRVLGCHDKCPKYAEYVKMIHAAKRKIIEENIIRDVEIGNTLTRLDRIRKHTRY